ncbi:MAG: DUF1015 family protein [Bacteroidia bacterium]|nr:DUF1015 family protein [Bacteroidia bacterium]
MAIIKAFKAFRPLPEKAKEVASRPYDVLNTQEAKVEADGNDLSFLHIVKPEIDFPADQDPYAPEVYQKGKSNFADLIQSGVFFQDEKPAIYIYRLEMGEVQQSGIVAAAAVSDYFDNVIKKHELTRPVKEEDRKNHVRVQRMNPEPVFFAYKQVQDLDQLVEEVESGEPEYDFTAVDGIRHILWKVDDEARVGEFIRLFAEKVPATYVADGHHRTAAAALVGQEIAAQNPSHTGSEDYNYFLAVHFPDNQLKILDYNRVVRDLGDYSDEEFLEKLKESFELEQVEAQYKPSLLHEFSLYMGGNWYRLHAKAGTYDDSDPIGVLDVTILSKQVLEPLLGIVDLRRDSRIEFVGGIRGLNELEKRVDSGEMAAAFALYPVSMQQLIDIADNDLLMPPKVTWFEPKLRSGLFVYKF